MPDTADTLVTPRRKAYARHSPPLCSPQPPPVKRTLPFTMEPGFHEPAKLWLYGNVKLLLAVSLT
jgi:hypothetical protein